MGITVLLLAPLQKKIDARIKHIKEETIKTLEIKLHREISYSSLSPSFFMFLELRNVVLLNTDGTAPAVSIGRVRIHYNLIKILKGNITGAIEGITLVRSTFSFDRKKDSDLLSLIKNMQDNGSTGGGTLPLLTLTGKNISVTIKTSKGMVTMNHLFFTLKNTSTGIRYAMKGYLSGKTDLFSPYHYFNLRTLTTRFNIFGTSNSSFSRFNTRVLLQNINSNLFSLRRLSLLVQREHGRFFARKIEDSSPLDLNMTYNLLKRRIDLSVISEKFIPSRYIHVPPHKSRYSSFFSASYTTNVKLHYSFAHNTLSYSGFIKTTGTNSPFVGNYTLASKMTGNNRHVFFSYLTLLSSYGTITYSGDLLLQKLEPSGSLQIEKLKLKGYTVSSRIMFSRKDTSFIMRSKKLTINNLVLSNLEGEFQYYKNDIGYMFSFSLPDPLKRGNTVSMDGSFQLRPAAELQVNISTNNVPLSPFFALAKNKKIPFRKKIETVHFSSNAFIDTNFRKTSFSVVKMRMYDSENNNNVIHFSASGNNEGVQISDLKAQWSGEKLTGTINLIKKGKEITVKSNTVFNAYPYKFDLQYNSYGLFINGDYGFNFAFLPSKNGANFMLHCEALPLPLRGNVTDITLDTSGYYFSPSNWKILLNTVLLQNIPLPVSENKLALTGEISQNEIQLQSIHYRDILSRISGKASFAYNIDSKSISGSLVASDKEKKETYEIQGTYKKETLDLSSTVSHVPLRRFKNSGLTGLISGNISIKGPLVNPAILLSLRVRNGLFKASPFTLNSTVKVVDNNIVLKSFQGKYDKNSFKDGKGSFDLKKGTYSFSTQYSGDFGGHRLSSHLSLDGFFSLPKTVSDTASSHLAMSKLLEQPFSLSFASSGGSVDKKKAVNWKMFVTRNKKNTVSFKGGPHNSISGSIKKTGEFNVHLKKDFPVRGNLYGRIKKGTIEAVFEESEIDLKVLNIFKIEGFAFTGGTAYGNVTIGGALNDPDFYGTLDVVHASGALSYFPDTIAPFNTRIVFKGKDMRVEPVDLKTGDALVRTEADFTFTRWVPSVFTIKFASLNKKGIHILYKVSSIGLTVDGYAWGNFALTGSPVTFGISGNLTVDDCVIALGAKKKEVPESSGISTSININFTTGKKVEFLWPSTRLPIVKAYADTNQKLHVLMDGINDTYSVKGTINVKYGEIYYFQRNFYLIKGAIIFNETEAAFDPLLDFKAQIREVDSKGEVVNVYMILDKTPLSRFSPRFESDPPLSTVEIMSMLGANVFAQLGGEKIDISSALMLTGDLVSQFSIMRGFEQKVKDIFKLDLFSIRTQMIQNIILNKFINDPASSNNSSDLFGKYLDNTTVYLGKYFGNTLFLQTMVQFGTDSPFVTEQSPDTGPLRVQTKVSLEWKTPLFLLDFSVEPDLLDPISSINNTSLSLSWGYSY